MTTFKLTISLLLTLLLAQSVAAHGWVSQLKVGSKTYPGNTPPSTTTPSAIRPVSTWSPVLGATNPSLSCGIDAIKAPEVATVAAGDELQFTWKTMMADGHWFHNTGPILTYMASCGSTACSSFDSTEAKWFKIAQLGQVPGSTAWYQANLMSGAPANVTVPANIKPGNYLIRHEIINLGRADSIDTGITEFFPSCSQLEVTGGGDGAPTDSELVSFPGAYTDKEPSIFDNAYNYKPGAYQFPGPAIAAFVSGSSSSGSGSGSSPSKSAGSSPVSASSVPTSSTKAKPAHTASPTNVNSTPTGVNSTPTGVNSTPTGANSTPTGANSTPTGANSTPAAAKPTATKGSCRPKRSSSQRRKRAAPGAEDAHAHPASDSYADSMPAKRAASPRAPSHSPSDGYAVAAGRMRRHSRRARAVHGSPLI
ncbi:hypothetical protein HWV62_3354 [Athelia sp. TMB]|nr:hypothetical protein HWV62_3354 [Athelia sp. TMB]